MKICGRVELELYSLLNTGGEFHKPAAFFLGENAPAFH
jgi:hypothetical protein